MGTYSLTVNIDSTQYPVLKNSGYNLCIAKKVNGVYNVVWSGTTFLQNNFFQWVEDYQVFGQLTFTPGALVRAQTLDQDIQFGQTCVLEADGVMDSATGPIDNSGTFHVINDFGPIHVGVNGSIGGKFLPIYVTPAIVSGEADLSPVVTLMAWFDLELETSVMFVKAISNLIEVKYLETTDHTVSYGGKTVGVWTLDAANGTSIVTPRLGYSSATGIVYEDSLIDPYTFAVAARSYQPESTQTVGSVRPRWVLECKISFTTSAVADASWAYLKQKIIPNLNQLVLPKTAELTFKVKLRWDVATFMPEMMKGETDEEKIKNAFNSELDALAIPPVSRQYTGGDVADIVSEAFALLALGTRIALDRDIYSKTSVVGYDVAKVSYLVL